MSDEAEMIMDDSEAAEPASAAGAEGDDSNVAGGEEPPAASKEPEVAESSGPVSPQKDVTITNESVVEAVLFSSDAPLAARKIAEILGVGDARDAKKHIAALNERYEASGASFRIEELAGGFQMLTLSAYNAWVSKLAKARSESKLSQAALETLAIVAYKQPVLRATVEAIRGVSAGDMLNRLREIGLVKIVGRAEDLGRPMLYGTTKRFLEVFGLSSLDGLPQIEELKPPA